MMQANGWPGHFVPYGIDQSHNQVRVGQQLPPPSVVHQPVIPPSVAQGMARPSVIHHQVQHPQAPPPTLPYSSPFMPSLSVVHRQIEPPRDPSPRLGYGFPGIAPQVVAPWVTHATVPSSTPFQTYQAPQVGTSGPKAFVSPQSVCLPPGGSTRSAVGISSASPAVPLPGSFEAPRAITFGLVDAPCVSQELEDEPFADEAGMHSETIMNSVKTWGRVPTDMIPPIRTAEDDPMPPEDALKLLKEGNSRFVNGTALAVRTSDRLRKDLNELGQAPHSAIVGCADSRCPIDMMFDAMPGDLFVLRNAGNTCTHAEGSIVGSLEYCVGHLKSRLILVLGHTKCGAIAGATQAYMDAKKSKESSKPQSSLEGLLSGLRSVAHQASVELGEDVDATRIAAHAVKVNVFHTMNFLLQYSKSIREKVMSGQVHIHGGIYELDTGRVIFLGPSPMQQQLLTSQVSVPPSFTGSSGNGIMMRGIHGIRTTADEIMSPADAIKVLREGNSRYVAGVPLAGSTNDFMRKALNDLGQAPHTAIVGCADSRCPVDTVFDCMPGELFVLRNAGNTCTHAEGATVGSLEYCIGNLRTKLILVLGHTNCGAIAGATATYLASKKNTKLPDSGGRGCALDVLLKDLGSVAKQAESELGEGASEKDIACRAVTVNVFNTIDFLLKFSKNIRNEVMSGELEVHGGVYNLETGKVDFLGPSPQQAEVIASQMLLPPSMISKVVSRVRTALDGAIAPDEALRLLHDGNERYATGTPWARNADSSMRAALLEHGQAPHAAIVGCSDSRCPIETMFDAMPGEIFVLRNAGNTCLHAEGSLVGSLEYCIGHLKTRLIMVVGHTKCGAIAAGTQAFLAGKRDQTGLVSNSLDCLLKDVGEVARHAANELGPGARPEDIVAHAVKVNVFQTMNFLLKYSPSIREKVRMGQAEIHGGIYHLDTGRVEFLGQSPAQHVLLESSGLLPPSLDKKKEKTDANFAGPVAGA